MLSLPVYPVRAYEKIFEQDGFKIIQTPKTRWVLDCPSLGGDYFARRLELLRMELPYKLYPLKGGFYSLSELILDKRKHRVFVDKTGKLIKWTPKQNYPAISVKLTEKWIPRDTPKLCFALEGSSEIYSIDAPNFVAEYARVVEVGNRRILYDVTEERMPNTRIKL